MQTDRNREGRPLSAEELEAKRKAEEDLGRRVWAQSTRTGANLPAPTTAALRALGAQVGAELFRMADAGVRAAADTATLGLADEISAGTNALLGQGGVGSFGQRYARLHDQEQQTDAYNHQYRPIATAAGQIGMEAVTFKGAAGGGAKYVSKLPSAVKGKIGERMSDARTLISGDIPIKHGRRLNLEGGGYTFTDHQTVGGKVVEAKLGPTAGLTKRQQQAQAELGPRYRYDHWSFNDVGNVIGGAVVGAQQGLNRISQDIQGALNPKRR